MKKLNALNLLLLAMICSISEMAATNYTFSGTGEWDDTAKWDSYPGTTIASSDTLFIQGDCTIAFGESIDMNGVLIINEDHSLICSGSIDSNGHIVVDGDLFVNSSIINRNTLIINGSAETDESSQLINTQNTLLEINGAFTNNSSVIQYSGEAKYNGDIINNGSMSGLANIERKSTANGSFVNNDYLSITGNARFESNIENSIEGVIIINGGSWTTFSDDVDFLNEGELRINGLLHVGKGVFNSSSSIKVALNGVLVQKKGIDSIL